MTDYQMAQIRARDMMANYRHELTPELISRRLRKAALNVTSYWDEQKTDEFKEGNTYKQNLIDDALRVDVTWLLPNNIWPVGTALIVERKSVNGDWFTLYDGQEYLCPKPQLYSSECCRIDEIDGEEVQI